MAAARTPSADAQEAQACNARHCACSGRLQTGHRAAGANHCRTAGDPSYGAPSSRPQASRAVDIAIVHVAAGSQCCVGKLTSSHCALRRRGQPGSAAATMSRDDLLREATAQVCRRVQQELQAAEDDAAVPPQQQTDHHQCLYLVAGFRPRL